MANNLRKFIFCKPVTIGLGLLAFYLAFGFLALPAIVKWQVEKQAPEMLGHPVSVGEVRFNPLLLKAEVGNLVLSDAAGKPILSFRRLLVDFEIRSAIDRAWNFAQVTLEAPILYIELDKEGRHNFAGMLERLRGDERDKASGPMPRFILQHVALSDGIVEYADRLLDKPLVARFEPLRFEVRDFSSLPARRASYELSAQSSAGETLEASGDIALDPMATKGKLALKGVKVVTLARGLSRWLALGSPAGQVGLAANFDLAIGADGALAARVEEVGLDVAAFSISAPGGSSPLLAAETLSLKQGRIDLGKREVAFSGFTLAKGSVAAAVDEKGGVDWAKLVRASGSPTQAGATKIPTAGPSTAPKSWQVSVARGDISDVAVKFTDAARGQGVKITSLGLAVSTSAEFGGPAGTRIKFDKPKLTIVGARLDSGADSVDVEGVVDAGRVAFTAADKGFDVGIEKPHATLKNLRMQSGESRAELGSAQIAGEQLLLAQAGGPMRISSTGAQLSISGLAVQKASSELARMTNGTLGAKLSVISVADGAVDASGEGLTATLSDVIVRSPADASELLRLGSASLSGGALRSGDRVVKVAKLTLSDGKVNTALDARGEFNWLSLFGGPAQPDAESKSSQHAAAPAGDAKVKAAAATLPRGQASSTAWRFALDQAALDRFAVGFEDRRASPPLVVGIENLRAGVSGLDTGAAAPMQVEVQAKVVSGGEIQASGKVYADSGRSDLKIAVSGIALAPVQNYLSDVAELRLASGTVSSAGGLRYGDVAGAGAKLVYAGSVAVDRVLLEEVQPKRPFLAWDAIDTDDFLLTLEPNRLDIGELRIKQPSGRLIIAADRSINLTDVLKEPKAKDAGQKKFPPSQAAPPKALDDTFPVSVSRVRVSGGVFEFADLSLRPQFSTRMHELKGVITSLGTDPDSSAKLQLDARVDKFGSAKIRGQVSVNQPEELTDIEMVFRNLQMTQLSPYIVKFAGYKIASGRLDLDLQYKVKKSKLVGENKVVLKGIALGEKVESPDALDLPLELAIAILKDANGVIDVGLPVRGDLDDPQFDYGEIIAKAFGNVVGGIVTAPFRALGAIFGGGGEKLGAIDFEPGSDVIAPPEREKLEAVARALQERPALKLIVPSTYAAEEDALALKKIAVRTEIVKRMGVVLASGEAPDPIDAENPRVQRAVEAAFNARFTAEALAVLKKRATEAATTTGETAAAGALPSADKAPRPPAEFYQQIVDRLIRDEPVSETALAQLAARRSEAIVQELTAEGGVPPARVAVGEPRNTLDAPDTSDANAKVVTLRLELSVVE